MRMRLFSVHAQIIIVIRGASVSSKGALGTSGGFFMIIPIAYQNNCYEVGLAIASISFSNSLWTCAMRLASSIDLKLFLAKSGVYWTLTGELFALSRRLSGVLTWNHTPLDNGAGKLFLRMGLIFFYMVKTKKLLISF